MSKRSSILQLTLGGIFAALICIATMFFQIPVSLTHGYIHLGDALILLCASLLGWIAVPAAAVGSLLADLLSGYAVYCLPTLIIKGGVALIVMLGVKSSTPLWRALIWFVVAECWMVLGYFLVEWLILGYGLAAAASAVVPNLMQGLSGVVLAGLFLKPFRMIYRRILH